MDRVYGSIEEVRKMAEKERGAERKNERARSY